MHSDNQIGAFIKEKWGGNADAQLFAVHSPWQIGNWIYESAHQQNYEVRAIHRAGDMMNGTVLCFKAKHSDLHCHPVLNGNWAGTWEGQNFHNLLIVDLCPLPGESGGPLFAYNWAYGIAKGRKLHPGGACSWGAFTYLRNFDREFGIEISTT